MRKVILGAFLLLMAGCYTQKVAKKQIAKAGAVYPSLLAQTCAEKFPVVAKEGKPIIKYIPAENKDYTGQIDSLSDALNWMRGLYEDAINAHMGDTSCQNTIRELQNRNDSLFRAFMDFKGKYIPCKPDTLKLTRVDTVPDLAAIAVRDGQIATLKLENKVLQQKLKTSRKWNWYLGIGLLLSMGWNFRKLIFKMFV